MAAVKYLSIDDLSYTLPDNFVYETMRDVFKNVVDLCSQKQAIPIKRLPAGPPPSAGHGLIVADFEHLQRIIEGKESIDDFINSSLANNRWFFNTFYYQTKSEYDGTDLFKLPNKKIGWSESSEVIVTES